MSYGAATLADTSSNQAIKDPRQWRCGYSNLGKIIVIKSGCDVCGCAYLAGKFPFPDILRLEQKVGLCAANNASVATNFRLFTSNLSFPQIFLRSTVKSEIGVTGTFNEFKSWIHIYQH
jgi:hypothetical protein